MALSGVLQSILAVVAMVGVLVLIHESGHFLVARFFGVTVKVFSVGVGARAFGVRVGHTDYRVSWLPIGGYVRWAGADAFSDGSVDEDGEPEDARGSFMAKPAWQRLLIVAAGPVTNLILPLFVFSALFLWGEPQWRADVGYVVPGSAAEVAGVQPGDRIVTVGTVATSTWVDVAEALEASSPVGSVSLGIERAGTARALDVPVADVDDVHHFGDYGLDPRAMDISLLVDDPASPAGRAGLRTGDRVRSVGGRDLTLWSELVAALQDKLSVDIVVERPGTAGSEARRHELRLQVDDAWTPTRFAADDALWARWGLAHGMLGVGTIGPLPDETASPAQCQGLQIGDRVLRIGDRDVRRWADVTAAVASTLPEGGALGDRAAAIPFKIRRAGVILDVPITPAVVQDVDTNRRYQVRPMVGFGPSGAFVYPPDVIRPYGPVAAVSRAVHATVGSAGRMIEQLGLMVTGGAPASQNLGGPIEIFATAGRAWEKGLFEAAATMALLSISLGVLNLLPVPVLDGGQIVMYLAEWVRGRPLPYRLRERLQQVGVLMLVTLFLVVSVWDVRRRFEPADDALPGEPAAAPKCA
ncbi:MAG: RIP metalloprotease RseP [Myxococcales bacterium]|nr:RIP metalloprotease RseP [Myxococcales bacterium]